MDSVGLGARDSEVDSVSWATAQADRARRARIENFMMCSLQLV